MIELDGAQGEGGGQILRSALTLSMITGQPFRITNIRANRPKPGLMRQHLVAVQAAAQVCGADIGELAVGAQALEFVPGRVQAGDYKFAIGSAGSCTLVLQTLLLALLFAERPSTLRIHGGTHNPMAPPAHFLERAFGRVLARMGAQVSFELTRYGFFPAGGGELAVRIEPCAQLQRIDLSQRGERVAGFAESVIAGVPFSVARRELDCIGKGMGWDESRLHVRGLANDQGPGNVLMLTLEHEHVTEVFSGFGEKAVRAETVAKQVLQQARQYIASNAAVGEHLADQLILPMALAGGGRFTASVLSQHARTNADVIARFLPVEVAFSEHAGCHLCTITSAVPAPTVSSGA